MAKIHLDDVLRAIRAHCLECSGHSTKEVENCRIKSCTLYPYRNTRVLNVETEEEVDKNQISVFWLMENGGDSDGRE